MSTRGFQARLLPLAVIAWASGCAEVEVESPCAQMAQNDCVRSAECTWEETSCVAAEAAAAPDARRPVITDDALVGGTLDSGLSDGGGGAGGGGPVAGPESRLLFFQVGDNAFVASAAGEAAQQICEGARAHPDSTGDRVLCVPPQSDAPLLLYDVRAQTVIATYEDWALSEDDPPALSPEGARVALRALNELQQDVIRVFDDGGNQLGEARGTGVMGFASEDVLLLSRHRPELWRIGRELVPIGGLDVRPIGPEPAGALYELQEPDSRVYFRDAESAEPRALTDGTVVATHGTRLLAQILFPDPELRLLDVASPDYLETRRVPTVGFDRNLGFGLAGPTTVVMESQRVASCNGVTVRLTTRTSLIEIDAAFERVVADTGEEAHAALVEPTGETTVVLALDACGARTGDGYVTSTRGPDPQRQRPLREVADRPLRDAALSRAGRYVAVAVSDGVRVLDVETGQVVTAAEGGAGAHLLFR